MAVNKKRREEAQKRMQAKMKQQFDNSAQGRQYKELTGMASTLGVDASSLGQMGMYYGIGGKKQKQRVSQQNNSILEKLRSQVNAASLAKSSQRPSITFGDAAPAALQAANQQANVAQPKPASPPMSAQPQQPQGLSLQQFQQAASPQPKPMAPVPQQPQQQAPIQQQQPSAQGFQPNQPQGAQQNNTTQRFQQLRNQFTQQPPMQAQPPKPATPPVQQQAPSPAQPPQPASQQTQQPAQQNPTEEEKKRLGQV